VQGLGGMGSGGHGMGSDELRRLPRKRQPFGLSLPCTYVYCRDGDTPVISITGGIKWAIRLIGVDCPELGELGGHAAAEYADAVLSISGGCLSVEIPAPHDIIHPLKSLTFDRLPGFIWIGPDKTINELIIKTGHGTLADGWQLPMGGNNDENGSAA